MKLLQSINNKKYFIIILIAFFAGAALIKWIFFDRESQLHFSKTLIQSDIIMPKATTIPYRAGPGILRIGIFVPQSTVAEYDNAIRMALEEINNTGGILGKQAEVEKFVEPDLLLDNLELKINQLLAGAHKFAFDKRVVGVISLTRAQGVVVTNQILLDKKKINISAVAVDASLTKMGFDNLFSTQVSDHESVRAIVKHAKDKKLGNFVVFSDNSIVAKNTTARFEAELADAGGKILYRSTGHSDKTSFEKSLLYMIDNDVFNVEDIDAVFVAAGRVEEYSIIISRLRELNIFQPIYGLRSLATDKLLEELTLKHIDDIYIVTPYNRDYDSDMAKKFKKTFMDKFGVPPDFADEEVYSAMKLLAYSINKTNSINSLDVGNFMRSMRFTKPFAAPSGEIVFDATGSITDTDIFILRFDGQKFMQSARYLIPFKNENSDTKSNTATIFNSLR